MSDIVTPRLRLARFTQNDWPLFLRLRQDPVVMRYMGEIADEKTLKTLFAQRIRHNSRVIKTLTGDALGDIGLRISCHNPYEADIGYALLPEAQGRGFAAEALSAMCQYGFNKAGLKAINAWVLGPNQASARLLERQGFLRIHVLENACTINGTAYDDWVYRLEAPQECLNRELMPG